jgi:purine-nucleoside phosphorylase
MIYILTALKSEAQAFVDLYKLKKSSLGDFVVFSNEKLLLIVSGLGVKNARAATQTLINHYDITDDDSYFNVGICGASKNYKIATLVEIGGVSYKDQEYLFKKNLPIITCVDTEVSSEGLELVDMESFGFYDAVIHNPAIKNFSIFKVVSDHFEPHTINKEKTKQLIFHKLKEIF